MGQPTIQAIPDEMNLQPKQQGKHKGLIGWRAKLEKGPNPVAVHHVDEIVREARRRLPTQQKSLAAIAWRHRLHADQTSRSLERGRASAFHLWHGQNAEIGGFSRRFRTTYRLVVIKKYLQVKQGQSLLFHDYRYFFYLTNDRASSPTAIVLEANDRCDQENLLAQLQGGVRAFTAPVDNLVSNWAYMVMASLAGNLKAWRALCLPEPAGPRGEKQRAEKQRVLRMEFKTFLNAFMQLPCQIVKAGGRLVYRLLGWNPWQNVFFRLVDRLQH